MVGDDADGIQIREGTAGVIGVQRLRDIWNGLGLATKQFLYLASVTLTLVLVLAWNNLNEAEKVFKGQVIRDAELLVARTNQYIDANLEHVENMLLLLSARGDLLSDGSEPKAIETLRNYADHGSSIVRTLYLVRSDGKVISNTQVFYEVIGNPHLKWLYSLGMDNYGSLNVSEPYDSPLSGHTVAYTMPVTDADNLVVGVAVVELNLEELTARIAPMIYQTFALVSDEGNLINRLSPGEKLLPTVRGTYPPDLEPEFLRQLMELRPGATVIEGREGPLMAVKSATNRLGWSLIAFIEEEYFYKDLQALRNNYQTATLSDFPVFSHIRRHYFLQGLRHSGRHHRQPLGGPLVQAFPGFLPIPLFRPAADQHRADQCLQTALGDVSAHHFRAAAQ